MKQNLGLTIIAATHDMKMLSTSDTVVWIKDGATDRVAKREELAIEVGKIDGETVA